ncbi:MAG: hypothetical protein AB1576_14150 [Bacillota bacterium]
MRFSEMSLMAFKARTPVRQVTAILDELEEDLVTVKEFLQNESVL